jgi:CheY-like chemotaxis protein
LAGSNKKGMRPREELRPSISIVVSLGTTMTWGHLPFSIARRATRELMEGNTNPLSASKRWLPVTVDETKAPVVLIVEDEFLIRAATADAIRDAGFEVLEAANADDAIELLEGRADIRVVFTDIHMPGSMDGVKLAHAVRHRWPPVRIIATSGRQLVLETDLPVDSVFLPKPYSHEALARVLSALIAS